MLMVSLWKNFWLPKASPSRIQFTPLLWEYGKFRRLQHNNVENAQLIIFQNEEIYVDARDSETLEVMCKKPRKQVPHREKPITHCRICTSWIQWFQFVEEKTAQDNRFPNRQCQLLPPLVGAANIVKDQRCQIHSGSNYSGLIKYTAQ